MRLLAVLGLLLLAAQAAMAQGVAVAPAGEPRPIYRWATDRCEDEFVPDSPARAFRRADGEMVLLATHRENWSLVGADFASLRPDCRTLLSSSVLAPSRLGELWIQATWTRDGRDIAALVSQDLSGLVRQAGCVRGDTPGRCWLNNILAARSTDMGRSFALNPPLRRVVATLGDHYPSDAQGRFGAFTTSNIVSQGGAYFVMLHLQGQRAQDAGNCLLRTADPFDPQSWRGWDGQDFTVDLAGAGPRPRCLALPQASLPSEIRSLGWDSRRRVWIAAFAARLRLPGDAQPVPGFYQAQSPDLLRWGTPQRIAAMPTRARVDSWESFAIYPSIIDPDSRSRNFDTLDSGHALLLYTLHHLDRGQGTMNRDLMALPLRLD